MLKSYMFSDTLAGTLIWYECFIDQLLPSTKSAGTSTGNYIILLYPKPKNVAFSDPENI